MADLEHSPEKQTPSTHSADDPRRNTEATLISTALTEAEALFGLREPSWTFTGYEFDINGPQMVVDIQKRHAIWSRVSARQKRQGVACGQIDSVLF